MAGVGALAGQQQHQEAEQVCAVWGGPGLRAVAPFVQCEGVAGMVQGREASSQHALPPTNHLQYKGGGWQGWGHWLGTGSSQHGTQQVLPFGEALVVAQSLGLASSAEWKAWCRRRAPRQRARRPRPGLRGRRVDGVGTHWLDHTNLDAARTNSKRPTPSRAGMAGSTCLR